MKMLIKSSEAGRRRRTLARLGAGAAVIALSVAFSDVAHAAGNAGTAKPPGGGGGGGGGGGAVPPTFVPPQPPVFGDKGTVPIDPLAFGNRANGFDLTGYIEASSVDNASSCDAAGGDNLSGLPNAVSQTPGGTVKVNGITIDVPCNLVLQFPANTMSWSDAVGKGFGDLASVEINVVGNIVDGKYRAGLILLSQQSANSGTGVVESIDYSKGRLTVRNPLSGDKVILEINDPQVGGTGRFSAGQTPDERFSVDNQNPTVKAATGYPMCIPRTDATAGQDDPLCPQQNRPTVANGCRKLSTALIESAVTFPAAFKAPAWLTNDVIGNGPAGGFCGSFVMPATTTVTADSTGTNLTVASSVDSRSRAATRTTSICRSPTRAT